MPLTPQQKCLLNNNHIIHKGALKKIFLRNIPKLQMLINEVLEACSIQHLFKEVLLHAVISNELPSVKLLLEHKIDPNTQNQKGETALHHAVILTGREEIVKILVAAGADPKSKNKLGFTPLDMANSSGNRKIVDIFKRKEIKDAEELRNAVLKEILLRDVPKLHMLEDEILNACSIKHLLKQGLMNVVMSDKLHSVELLLENKVDPNPPNEKGNTPLHYAVYKRHKEMVEILVAAGADPKFKNNRDIAPLDMVDSSNNEKIFDILTGKEIKDSKDSNATNNGSPNDSEDAPNDSTNPSKGNHSENQSNFSDIDINFMDGESGITLNNNKQNSLSSNTEQSQTSPGAGKIKEQLDKELEELKDLGKNTSFLSLIYRYNGLMKFIKEFLKEMNTEGIIKQIINAISVDPTKVADSDEYYYDSSDMAEIKHDMAKFAPHLAGLNTDCITN